MQKKELYKSKFSTVSYSVDTKIMEQIWHNSNADMTDEDYKHEMLIFVEKFNQSANKFLIDSTGINKVIPVELQEWVGQNIASKLINQVDKAAFIVPGNIFEEVSIEQTNEEHADAFEKTKYFSSLDDANEWLN